MKGLIVVDKFSSKFDQVDIDAGTYKAMVGSLDVVNANRRMLASGILGSESIVVIGSDWNHSSGRGDRMPVSVAKLVEADKQITANFQHDVDDEQSMAALRRVGFLHAQGVAVEFSLGYRINEYSINYEKEYIKILDADFGEVTPAVFGASPGTKILDSATDAEFDTALKAELAKQGTNEPGPTVVDLSKVETVSLVNEMRKRKFDFRVLS